MTKNYKTVRMCDLDSVSFDDRGGLPSRPGVYAATRGKKILYVGQSIDLKKRWRSGHHQILPLSILGCKKVKYFEVAEPELDDAENDWIDRFKPSLNNSSIKSAEALKSLIMKDVRREQRESLRHIEERMYLDFKSRMIDEFYENNRRWFDVSQVSDRRPSEIFTINMTAQEQAFVEVLLQEYAVTRVELVTRAFQLGMKELADKANVHVQDG